MSQPPGVERQGWVDDDYYDSNPWYGQAKEKPVYSLGRPLPHKSRFQKKKEAEAQQNGDVEKGQGGMKSKASRKGKRVQIADNGDDSQQQMLNRGGTGGQSMRRNDSGQPIYDHQPWDADFRVPDLTTSQGEKAPEDREGENYNVGGERIGQREDDEAEEGQRDPNDLRNWWARMRAKNPEPLAEFAAVSIPMVSRIVGRCR